MSRTPCDTRSAARRRLPVPAAGAHVEARPRGHPGVVRADDAPARLRPGPASRAARRVIASNHIAGRRPDRRSAWPARASIRYMAKIELWRVPVLRRVIPHTGAFPVDRGNAGRETINQARAVLRSGNLLGDLRRGHPPDQRRDRRGAHRRGDVRGARERRDHHRLHHRNRPPRAQSVPPRGGGVGHADRRVWRRKGREGVPCDSSGSRGRAARDCASSSTPRNRPGSHATPCRLFPDPPWRSRHDRGRRSAPRTTARQKPARTRRPRVRRRGPAPHCRHGRGDRLPERGQVDAREPAARPPRDRGAPGARRDARPQGDRSSSGTAS